MRKLFKLPVRAHNYIVNGLCESIVVKLDRRLMKYIYNMLNSENRTIRSMMYVFIKSNSSVFAENYRYLMYKYEMCYEDWNSDLQSIIRKTYRDNDLTNRQRLNIDIIKELCSVRDSMLDTALYVSKRNIQILIDEICTE